MRSHLGRVDGHRCIFGANADSHDKTGCKKALPALSTCGADGGNGEDECGEEDLASSSKPVVERIDDECATGGIRLECGQLGKSGGRGDDALVAVALDNLHEACSEEDNGIDEANDPLISAFLINAELLREGQVGTIGSSLVPTLGCGSDGAQANRVPEHGWTVPLVIPFVYECLALAGFKLSLAKHLKSLRITGDKSSAAEELSVLGHAVSLRPFPGVVDNISLGLVLYNRTEDLR